MSLTYKQFSELPRSEKIVLGHIEPSQQLTGFSLVVFDTYEKVVNYFVVSVKNGTTELTRNPSFISVSPGEWAFDPLRNKLFIRLSDNSDPNAADIVVTYRMFVSNTPISLPYDLSTGEEVYYNGRLDRLSDIKEELDSEQTGVALESNTTISLQNQDGYYDDTYDVLTWENKTVKLWSWSPLIALTEKEKLFNGTIQDKSFSDRQISFKCKDFVYELRKPVDLTLFTSSDGTLAESVIGTPKRRLYGQFEKLQCVPVDNTLNGYTLTGTLSGVVGSTTVTGIGTDFINELSPEDEISLTLNDVVFSYSVESVDSATQVTLSDTIEASLNSATATNEPSVPYRGKNRTFHIAGHLLRKPSTTINTVTSATRFTVNNITDFLVDDQIEVDGVNAIIRRIVNNEITLRQALSITPSPGDSVVKEPVSQVFIRNKRAVLNRDYTIINTSTDAKVVFNSLAEFNVTAKKTLPGSWTFTNGSDEITVSGVDALNYFQTRDWIRSDDITHTTWYEILKVEEGTIKVRSNYGGSTITTTAEGKNVKYIDDETLVTVDCVGYQDGSTWLKTAGHAVEHLLTNDLDMAINAASFTDAKSQAPQVLSLPIPKKIGDDAPAIRDVVNNINETIFGSLSTNNNFELKYTVLNSEKPADLEKLKDDDIVGSIRVKSQNNIVRKINAKYRPFVDQFKQEDTFKLYEFTSDFVDRMVSLKTEKDVILYLYDDADAETIAQRYALFNSLSSSIVSVRGKLNLATKKLNDKVWLAFDRLYKRFGGQDRQKIGIVSSISKDGLNVDIEFNDLGNIFNRVMSVAPNTSGQFTSATDDEKIFNGYIVNNDTKIPDSGAESYKDSNIIG